MAKQNELDLGEARDPDTGLNNTDHLLLAGTVRDTRLYAWGEDSDQEHRVRRQSDRYFDAREPGSTPLKRGDAEDLRRIERGRWHVGAVREGWDWTCPKLPQTRETRSRCEAATGLIGMPESLPEEKGSPSPARCDVCWDALPSAAGKGKYCGKPCQRVADKLRKARKRRLARGLRKYPCYRGGGYVNQDVASPRSGIQYTREVSRTVDLEVRHGIMRGVRRSGEPSLAWSEIRAAILIGDWHADQAA